MKNSQIQKPSLSDYKKIEDFTNACFDLQLTINRLNQHIEILKRSAHVEDIREFDFHLRKFLFSSIDTYKKTLKADED